VTALLERLTHNPSRVAALFFVGAFVLAVLVSAGAVSAAIARGQVGSRLLSYVRAPAALVALAMAAMLTSTVVWGLSLRAYAPGLFAEMDATGAYGVFTWTRVVALMALATLAALASSTRCKCCCAVGWKSLCSRRWATGGATS